MPELYQLHPVSVHFPIALLILGFAVQALSQFLKGENAAWLAKAAPWFLWIGTLSAIAALGLGLLAEKLAPHVPAAWETVEEHEELAYWTAGLFSALSICRIAIKTRWEGLEKKWKLAFLTCGAIALGVMIATAQHGGELVYKFGMGIKPVQ